MRITTLENSKLRAKLLTASVYCSRGAIDKIIHVTMQLCRKSVNRTKIQTFKESVEKETKEH